MAANDELTRLRAENEVLEEQEHHLRASGSMQAALEARKAEAADLEKQIAELEESAQAGDAPPPASD
jgi:hypothetical protein